MKPKICVAIVENELKSIVRSSKKAQERGADLLELRLDFVPDLTKEKVQKITKTVKDIGLPVILTIRKEIQGGDLSKQKEQIQLLLSGIDNVDYIDIELETDQEIMNDFIKQIKKTNVQLIISHHDLEKTPSLEKVLGILEKEKELGADICKLVCKANDVYDNSTMLSANLKFNHKKIVLCMGELGILSRILSPLFGSEFTFASLESKKESAPGQLDIETTKMILSEIRSD